MAASTAPASATSFQNNARPWWLVLIDGIAITIIGAVFIFGSAQTKIETWLFLVTLLGIWWLIRGILDIVSMFIDHTAWGWKLFMGIISIIAGSYILMYPIAAAIALPKIFVLILGIWGLVQGVVMLTLAFRGGGWGPGILGALAILFGLILIANWSNIGVGISFVWVAAFFALIGGILMIIQSFRQRSAGG